MYQNNQPHRLLTPEEKAKIAILAIKGKQGPTAISRQYDTTPTTVNNYKYRLLNRAHELFGGETADEFKQDSDPEIDAAFAQAAAKVKEEAETKSRNAQTVQPSIFDAPPSQQAHSTFIDRLYRKIGELEMELDYYRRRQYHQTDEAAVV